MALTPEEKRLKKLASVLKKITAKTAQKDKTVSRLGATTLKQSATAEQLRTATEPKIVAKLTKLNNSLIEKIGRYDALFNRLNAELVELETQRIVLSGTVIF